MSLSRRKTSKYPKKAKLPVVVEAGTGARRAADEARKFEAEKIKKNQKLAARKIREQLKDKTFRVEPLTADPELLE